jgi:hypothetical protein
VLRIKELQGKSWGAKSFRMRRSEGAPEVHGIKGLLEAIHGSVGKTGVSWWAGSGWAARGRQERSEEVMGSVSTRVYSSQGETGDGNKEVKVGAGIWAGASDARV